jgi:serine/threonine-protein kinase
MSSGSGPPIRFGVYEVDLESGELRKQGLRIKLRDQPLQILLMLLEQPGHVVSREELQGKLWAADTFVDFDRGLNKAINHLREALGDSAESPRFIETLPKRGYRFIAPVDVPPAAPHPDPVPHRATPPTATQRSWRSGLPWALAGVFAVIAATSGVLLWRATRPADKPMMRLSVDLGPEAIRGWMPLLGTSHMAAISPDGTRLVFPVRSGSGGYQLATRLLDQTATTVLAGTEGAFDPFFSPDGKWIGFFANQKMMKIPAQGGEAVPLCDALPVARGGAWGEDGYIVANLDVRHLFRVPAAVGKPQLVGTPEEHGERTWRWPQILPGGENVLFTGAAAGGAVAIDNANIEVLSLKTGQVKIVLRGGYFGRYLPSGHLVYFRGTMLFGVRFDLARLEAGTSPLPLLEDVAEFSNTAGRFDFSRSGTLVYLNSRGRGGVSPLAWMDRTGKVQPLRTTPSQAETPRLSPDGNRLALATTGDLWVYDLQRDRKTQLTFNASQNRHPVWMPDGKHLIFDSGLPTPQGDYGVWWIRSDGSGQPQKLFGGKTPLQPYSISPNGRRVAFVRTGGDPYFFEIWTLPLHPDDLDHPRPGTPEPFLRELNGQVDPAISPDGHWMAYASVSVQSGRPQVVVRPFPSRPSSLRSPISNGPGQYPIWSRNGRELFYLNSDNNRIMAVHYTAGEDSFEATKPYEWSPGSLFRPQNNIWNLDLAPDGTRFVVLAQPATSAEPATVYATVLLNFFDELRRRLPATNK